MSTVLLYSPLLLYTTDKRGYCITVLPSITVHDRLEGVLYYCTPLYYCTRQIRGGTVLLYSLYYCPRQRGYCITVLPSITVHDRLEGYCITVLPSITVHDRLEGVLYYCTPLYYCTRQIRGGTVLLYSPLLLYTTD